MQVAATRRLLNQVGGGGGFIVRTLNVIYRDKKQSFKTPTRLSLALPHKQTGYSLRPGLAPSRSPSRGLPPPLERANLR